MSFPDHKLDSPKNEQLAMTRVVNDQLQIAE